MAKVESCAGAGEPEGCQQHRQGRYCLTLLNAERHFFSGALPLQMAGVGGYLILHCNELLAEANKLFCILCHMQVGRWLVVPRFCYACLSLE